MEIISQLENGKSSDIPIRVIKKSAHIICPVLAQHFNKLMMTGVFPDVLKVGKVTPIFKKGLTKRMLEIIDLSLHCLYLVRYLKK